MSFNFVKITERLPIQPLITQLEANPYLWDAETLRQTYPGSAHKDTRCIFLRWLENPAFELSLQDGPITNCPAFNLLPAARDLIRTLERCLKWEKLGRVIITELKPEGFILPHTDEGEYADRYERFHVPLITGIGNHFFVSKSEHEGEYVHMLPGELWCFNHKRRHWFHNASLVPRLHFILDAIVPRYRNERDMIATPTLTTFQEERAEDCFDEAMPLLKAHWEEIAQYKDIPLEIDFEVYKKIEDSGLLKVFTARKAKLLIGYAVYFLRNNPHYKSSRQAVQDILYIHPAHRGGGGKFILWCDEQLKAAGVQIVYHHVKTAHNFGPLLERFGYTHVENIYSRRLDQDGN